MGNASSIDSSVVAYLEVNGKQEKIVFSKHCSSRDIHDLVAQAAGCSKYCILTLKDPNGAHISMSPTMPSNTPSSPYKVQISQPTSNQGDSEVLTHLMTHVADQFNKAFKVEEMRSEISTRLTALERKLEMEGLKAVEIEKCKKDISEIKDQIWTAQKKFVDFNRMSIEDASSLSDERKICLKRDIPSYPKYTLSQETIDYLKQPTFDIW
ncbi:high affinity cGMP-specific 3',5'-cyclic phosphodiesterase 9A-like, partial [Ruditapes philippinarum]|uniref:high affinity cGMP-specific 3',5'-cyclic phosphodiesterase 9A-like n=1 Tax=Ruditapes philippinarum TaxID=129788 RepID=UPI00295A65D3